MLFCGSRLACASNNVMRAMTCSPLLFKRFFEPICTKGLLGKRLWYTILFKAILRHMPYTRLFGEQMQSINVFAPSVLSEWTRVKRRRVCGLVAATTLFVIVCGCFVALGVTQALPYWVCWLVCSCVSVAYFWLVLLFVKLPSERQLLLRLAARLHEADKTYVCGKYCGCGDREDLDGIDCAVLRFDEENLLLPSLIENPFCMGDAYRLTVVGRLIVGYSAEE